jgi:hypothetical protein
MFRGQTIYAIGPPEYVIHPLIKIQGAVLIFRTKILLFFDFFYFLYCYYFYLPYFLFAGAFEHCNR